MEITLSSGAVVLFDDADNEIVSKYFWSELRGPRTSYADAFTRDGVVLMHRILMNPPKGYVVDHINNNGLDNRRQNLRVVTQSENIRRAGIRVNNTSGIIGVHWNEETKRWRATFRGPNGKKVYAGVFKTKDEAAVALAKKRHDVFTQGRPFPQ